VAQPVGGDRGVVRKAFGLEPSGDVRPPVAWSAEDVQDGLRRVERELDECRQGVRGVFTATMYVDTNGSPLAVGMTPPSDEGEAVVDCLVDVLESARSARPGLAGQGDVRAVTDAGARADGELLRAGAHW
jgi:hypothetical protein